MKHINFEVRLAAIDEKRKALRSLREIGSHALKRSNGEWLSTRFYIPLDCAIYVLVRLHKWEKDIADAESDNTKFAESDHYHIKLDVSGGVHKETCILPTDKWKIWAHDPLSLTGLDTAKFVICSADVKGMVGSEDGLTVYIEEPNNEDGQDLEKIYEFDFDDRDPDVALEAGADLERPFFEDESLDPVFTELGCGSERFDCIDANISRAAGHCDKGQASRSAPSTPQRKRTYDGTIVKGWQSEPRNGSKSAKKSFAIGTLAFDSDAHKEAMIAAEHKTLRATEKRIATLKKLSEQEDAEYEDEVKRYETDYICALEKKQKTCHAKQKRIEKEYGLHVEQEKAAQRFELVSACCEAQMNLQINQSLLQELGEAAVTEAERMRKDMSTVVIASSDEESDDEGRGVPRKSVVRREGQQTASKQEVLNAFTLGNKIAQNEASIRQIKSEIQEIDLFLKKRPEEYEESMERTRKEFTDYAASKSKYFDVKRHDRDNVHTERKEKLFRDIELLQKTHKQTCDYIAILESAPGERFKPRVEDRDIILVDSSTDSDVHLLKNS